MSICLLLLTALLPTVRSYASGVADSVYFHIRLDTLGNVHIGQVLQLTYALVNSSSAVPFDSVAPPVFNADE